MRMMWTGLAGWARMGKPASETMRVTDTAITVVGTLLVAVTWVMLR